MTRKKQTRAARERDVRQRAVRHILHEWDCRTLEEAVERAKTDKALHYALREIGVRF